MSKGVGVLGGKGCGSCGYLCVYSGRKPTGCVEGRILCPAGGLGGEEDSDSAGCPGGGGGDEGDCGELERGVGVFLEVV